LQRKRREVVAGCARRGHSTCAVSLPGQHVLWGYPDSCVRANNEGEPAVEVLALGNERRQFGAAKMVRSGSDPEPLVVDKPRRWAGSSATRTRSGAWFGRTGRRGGTQTSPPALRSGGVIAERMDSSVEAAAYCLRTESGSKMLKCRSEP
jgi:hypothetical protein